MKKMVSLFLAFVMVVFSGCAKYNDTETSNVETSNDEHPAEIAVSIGEATEEQLSKDGYVHFCDQDSHNTEWKIVVTVNAEIDSLSFIEIDESDETRIGKVLFEDESPKTGGSYIFHTYINDAALNRGISYKDKNGLVRYFGINFSMDDGSLNLIEFEI